MSAILVCPEAEAAGVAAEYGPSHVLALSSPDGEPPFVAAGHRLALVFHDVAAPGAGLIAPDGEAIRRLLVFGATWPEQRPLLVHCRMGISRSTAAALILAAAARPARPETNLALALRAVAPCATPNPLMIALADEMLGRAGRLVEAVRAIGRGADYRPYRLTSLALA